MELNRELRGRAAEIILSAATFSTAALSTLGLSGCAARPEAAEASVRTSALDTGFSPQTQIRKDEAEYSIELLPSRNSEGLLIDGNHKITSYQDIDGNVYVVMKDNTFQSSIDSNQNKDMKFGGHIFYLGPRATVEQSVLDRAFKERVPSNSNLKEGQYEMTVTIPLLTEANKQNAANALNKRFPQAGGATADNMVIAPYRLLEVFGEVGGESVKLGTWPKITAGSNTLDIPDARPTSITVKILGSEDELKAFTENGHFKLRYYLGGFTVKRNTLSLALEAIFNSEFRHLLTGDAKWSERSSIKSRSGGGGVSLDFFTGGVSNTKGTAVLEKNCLVTRNQVKEIARLACVSLRIHEYREFKDDNNRMEKFIDLLTARMLAKMEEVELQIKEDGTLILGKELERDMAPDVIKSLNQAIKDKTVAKNSKSANVTSGKVTAGGSQSYEFFNDDEVSFGTTADGIVIPKQVRIYQANTANLKVDDSMNATIIEAQEGHQAFLQSGAVIRTTDKPSAPAQAKKIQIQGEWKIKQLRRVLNGTTPSTGTYKFKSDQPILSQDSKGRPIVLIPYQIQLNSTPRLRSTRTSGGFGGGLSFTPGTRLVSEGYLTIPINAPGKVLTLTKTKGLTHSGHFGGKKGQNAKSFAKDAPGSGFTHFEVTIDPSNPEKGSLIGGKVKFQIEAEIKPASKGQRTIEILPRE